MYWATGWIVEAVGCVGREATQNARSEGGNTRHPSGDPLAAVWSRAVSAAVGEVNPLAGEVVGVVDAGATGWAATGAPIRDVDGDLASRLCMNARPPTTSATTATAVATTQTGRRTEDRAPEFAAPGAANCQSVGCAADGAVGGLE
jgi:hypothetical protein